MPVTPNDGHSLDKLKSVKTLTSSLSALRVRFRPQGAGTHVSGEASGSGPRLHLCGKTKTREETELCHVYLATSAPSHFCMRETVSDIFPPRTTRTKKPRHPVAFYTHTHQKNHRLLDSRLFSGEMFYCKGHFFFLNVLYDLQKAAALTRYYALDYFLPFLHLPSGKEFKPFDFPDIFP